MNPIHAERSLPIPLPKGLHPRSQFLETHQDAKAFGSIRDRIAAQQNVAQMLASFGFEPAAWARMGLTAVQAVSKLEQLRQEPDEIGSSQLTYLSGSARGRPDSTNRKVNVVWFDPCHPQALLRDALSQWRCFPDNARQCATMRGSHLSMSA